MLTDLTGLAARGRPIDGVFGYDFFSRLIVTIDEDNQRLILTDPATFEYRGTGEVLPLTFGGGRGKWIYIPGTIKVTGVPAEALPIFADTGSSDAVDTYSGKRIILEQGKHFEDPF